MLLRLFGLFIVGEIVELALLVWLCQQTSLGFTLSLVVGSALVGCWLLREQSRRFWRSARQADAARAGEPLFDRFLTILAGILLILPGLVSDLAAGALLFAPVRRYLTRHAAQWVATNFRFTEFNRQGGAWQRSEFSAGGADYGRASEALVHDRVIEARVIHTDGPRA